MLDVNNISLYYGAAQALRGVSLKAEPGKVTCVLGRNGVGKTSLLRAMVGQYPIASGSINFDGADITALKPYERARKGIPALYRWNLGSPIPAYERGRGDKGLYTDSGRSFGGLS